MDSIVTIGTPATSSALTTRTNVKAEIAALNDASLDTWTDAAIIRASAMLARECSRVFGSETVTETFRIHGRFRSHHVGPNVLALSRYPNVSITSVSLNDTVMTTDEYEVEPNGGMLYRLSGNCRISWYGPKVDVVYSAGYSLPGSVPADLERAAIQLIGSLYFARGQNPLIKSEDIPGVQRIDYWVGGVGENAAIPPDVMDMIQPFRRLDR